LAQLAKQKEIQMRQYQTNRFSSPGNVKDVLVKLLKRGGATIAAIGLLTIGAVIAGCGGGGSSGDPGVSPQVVSGVAATGSPLVGQVSLRDSSTQADKVTNIANDGSFAIDVSDRTAPFILKATGIVDGVSRTIFSFSNGPGIANINPLTNIAVANAAGVDDPAEVFEKHDLAMLNQVRSAMPGSVTMLQSKLQPLLDAFSVAGTNPVTSAFSADHDGLDGVFDNVKVVISNGILTITNVNTGAVIFTAQVKEKDFEHGVFTDNDMPKPGPRPAVPTGLTAVGGDAQVTVSWDSVAGATSYDLFYATQSKVAEEVDRDDVDAKRVSKVTSPFVLTGLVPSTTYFIIVRAGNNGSRGSATAEVSATTSGTTPVVTIPAAPSGVTATGGTKQATISWPAVTGATSYNLYSSTTTGVTTVNGTKTSGVTSPSVQIGLPDSTAFFYILTAVNSAGESAASVQVTATTLAANAPPPAVPTAPISVTAVGGGLQVTVSWSAVTGADSYNVYFSTTSGVTATAPNKIPTSVAGSPFVHTGRAASTAYFYIVTAVNGGGESVASAVVTATTNAAPPPIDGVALYTTECGGCHGDPIASSEKRGRTALQITNAIAANRGGMGSISLTPAQVNAIAAALL
jgi:mono/diheme cytochrome c family protein